MFISRFSFFAAIGGHWRLPFKQSVLIREIRVLI